MFKKCLKYKYSSFSVMETHIALILTGPPVGKNLFCMKTFHFLHYSSILAIWGREAIQVYSAQM
jgi:hypothetical protein